MQSTAKTVNEYVDSLPEERKAVIQKLRETLLKNLPKWFEEQMQYGMIWYVVPLSLYPNWYHCKKWEPLTFLALASQKNFIALYHMWLYADQKMFDWFTQAWEKKYPQKLDMWKSCIRFKKVEAIPYELIWELVSKVTPQEWIEKYEKSFKK